MAAKSPPSFKLLGTPLYATAVPDYVADDLDQRLGEPLTLTQKICGDPPFSRSALARKQDNGAAPYYTKRFVESEADDDEENDPAA